VNQRLIKIFRAIMTCETTVGASQKLAISQPAVSNALGTLEAELGFRLFNRNGNRLVAREEAKVLFAASDAMFLYSEALEQTIEDLRENRLGHVYVSATPPLWHSVLPGAIQRFMADRPAVKVFCDVGDSRKVIESVESAAADLGLANALEPELRNTLQMVKIGSGGMVCVVPPGHQLARRLVLTPIDLKPFSMIGFSGSSRLGPLVRHAYRTAGVPYKAAIEVHSAETACLLVGAGAGIAVIDIFSALARAKEQHFIAIPFRPETVVDAWAIFKKERPLSRLAVALLNATEHAAREFLEQHATSKSEQSGGSSPVRRRTKARGR